MQFNLLLCKLIRPKMINMPIYILTFCTWAVVVVKWSVGLPSTPTIRVRIFLMGTVFCVKFVFEKNENKQKEAW